MQLQLLLSQTTVNSFMAARLAPYEQVVNMESEDTHAYDFPFEAAKTATASHTSLSSNVLPTSSHVPQDEKDKKPELENVVFEAQSSRDFAWYDVRTFLDSRIRNHHVEVKARFQDAGEEEDEWVNLKKAVRVQSIPLESSDCIKVHVGDLVLCFQEGYEPNNGVHYNAHVIEIERELHGLEECRCLFLLRYDHDQTEEKVQYTRLCRRPKF